MILAVFYLKTTTTHAQEKVSFGVHADPVISWFGTDISSVNNEGARSGFNFGISFAWYFSSNYSVSSGINLLSTAGRISHAAESTILELGKKDNIVPVSLGAGNSLIYKIQYISLPVGLKLQTNQIGYITFFTDLGIDPKVIVNGKADIPSLNIKGEIAGEELRNFNISYHIHAGIEYGLGGNTALILGLGFENIFMDVTRETGNQPADKVTQKLLSVRMGIKF